MLVPDLYKGKVGVDAEEASHVRRGALPVCRQHASQPRGAERVKMWLYARALGPAAVCGVPSPYARARTARGPRRHSGV